MLFLRRSLTGILLMALTLAGIALSASLVYDAVIAARDDGDGPRQRDERAQAVDVVTLRPGQAEPVLETFGQIRSRRTLDIRAPASGVLASLSDSFVEGGEVGSGAVLLAVDPAEAQAALFTAETGLAEAEADLRDARRGLELAREDVAAAAEQADLRRAALMRQQDLETRGFGSSAAVEEAALAASAARQSLVTRRQALATAEARIDQAGTMLERRRIALGEARRTLDETVIRADFNGRLTDVAVLQGGRVSAGEVLARLVDPQMLEVAFRLSTAQYARLTDETGRLARAGIDVALEVAGLTLLARGRIVREAATVGEGQTGRQLYASLDAPGGLRPGDIVTVRITEPPLEGVADLPSLAVDAGSTVLVVGQNNRLQPAAVTVLRRQGDRVLVRADDLDGALVVARRGPALGAGLLVTPTGLPPRDDADGVVTLTPERRAELIAFVEDNSALFSGETDRFLNQLGQEQVPAQVVRGIEQRMGS